MELDDLGIGDLPLADQYETRFTTSISNGMGLNLPSNAMIMRPFIRLPPQNIHRTITLRGWTR